MAGLYATQSDRYVVTLPTTADDGPEGPAYTQFYVIAHTTTPTVIYASVADSGRSVDNIAPGAPSGFAAAATVTGIDGNAAPARFALRSNETNPFNPATTIHYDVPAGGGALRLSIYDARGRLVRKLANGVEPAGRRSILWNGRDDNGRAVPTGVYFCRLTAPGYARSVKMSLVQ